MPKAEMLWKAAKFSAATSLLKEKSNGKAKLLDKIRNRKYQELKNTTKPEEDKVEERQKLVRQCSIMNQSEDVEVSDCIEKLHRKKGVCEKDELDRKLVLYTIKYYRQMSFISSHLGSL